MPKNILSEDDIRDIVQSLRQTLGQAIEIPKVYRLGRLETDGTVTVQVENPEKRGMVWVRNLGQGAGDAIPAINTSLPTERLIPNSFVKCKPEGGYLTIIGESVENADYAGDVVTRPQSWTSLSQFDHGLLRPTDPPSMICLVTAAIRNLDGTLYYADTLPTKDFTADIPGSDAVGVLVEFDPVLETFTYTTSSSFGLDLDLVDAFDTYLTKTANDSRFVCGWVRLYQGQDTVRKSDILTGQEVLFKTTASGGTVDFDGILTFEGIVMTHSGNVLEYETP